MPQTKRKNDTLNKDLKDLKDVADQSSVNKEAQSGCVEEVFKTAEAKNETNVEKVKEKMDGPKEDNENQNPNNQPVKDKPSD